MYFSIQVNKEPTARRFFGLVETEDGRLRASSFSTIWACQPSFSHAVSLRRFKAVIVCHDRFYIMKPEPLLMREPRPIFDSSRVGA
jgi:hypothetical protein